MKPDPKIARLEARLAACRSLRPSMKLRERALAAAAAAWIAPRPAGLRALDFALALRRPLLALAATLALCIGLGAIPATGDGRPAPRTVRMELPAADLVPAEWAGRVLGTARIVPARPTAAALAAHRRQRLEWLEIITKGNVL